MEIQNQNANHAQKNKAIELAVQAIEKQFGKGSIMRMGTSEHVPVSVISTGSISLDLALEHVEIDVRRGQRDERALDEQSADAARRLSWPEGRLRF